MDDGQTRDTKPDTKPGKKKMGYDPRVLAGLDDACQGVAREAGELGLAVFALARLKDESWPSEALGTAFGRVWVAACHLERTLCRLFALEPPCPVVPRPATVRHPRRPASRPERRERPESEARDGDA